MKRIVPYLSLMLLGLVSGGYTVLDRRNKYGCLFIPELCIPPEDCDGMTGHCHVPVGRGGQEYTSEDVQMLIKSLETYGYDIYDRKMDTYPDSDSPRKYSGPNDKEPLEWARDILASKTHQLHKARERRHSTSQNNQPQFLISQDYSDTAGNAQAEEVKSEETKSQIKRLVAEAKAVLRSHGKTLSDLGSDKLKILAKYLAKMIKTDHSHATGTLDDSAHSDSYYGIKKVVNNGGGKEEPAVAQLQQSPKDTSFQVEDRNVEKNVEKGSTSTATQSSVNASRAKVQKDTLYVVIIVVGATVLLIILVTIITCVVYSYQTRKQEDIKAIRNMTSGVGGPFGDDYQDLCRQHYANKNSDVANDERTDDESLPAVREPLITKSYPLTKPTANGVGPSRLDSTPGSSQAVTTRNSSVSSVSWSEEPVTASLDITTGHAVLSYMEDHLKNKNRLDKEWEEICRYEADSITTAAAITAQNSRKNRSLAALPYDHNRIKLNAEINHVNSDYINASSIIDNDPKRPLYIAAQGPLPSTIPDFWQMMWEQDCVAIVMLTPLVEEGVNQCARYWPDEGSCTYSNFEIHLVSEHIWCEDYLVRSLYLKHLGTGETRTVTQFHFLSWPKDRVPSTPKPLLELRRKVTKCYKGHNSPVLVHCSDGVGRTGTYILLDLAIDRMLRGAKEIDISATLEHIRDQRVGMVATKEQFEFALTAVAEEVNAILKTLLH